MKDRDMIEGKQVEESVTMSQESSEVPSQSSDSDLVDLSLMEAELVLEAVQDKVDDF